MEQNQNNQESNNKPQDLINDDSALVAHLMAQRGQAAPAAEAPAAQAPAAEAAAAPANVEITDDKFNEWLEKKTEGKFKRLDEIEIAELPESSKQLYDLLKEGKTDDIYDYIVKSKVDYSKFDHTDLLRAKIARENPSISKEDVEDILIHDYKIGSELTEDEKDNLTPRELAAYEQDLKRASIRAKQDAEAMRTQLESEKKELSLPEIKKLEVTKNVDPNQPTEEQLLQAMNEWTAEVESELPKVKELVFDVEVGDAKDKFSSSFKLDANQEAAVKKALLNGLEQGDEALPFNVLVEKTAFKLYGKQIVAAAIKDAVAKAKEQFVEKELKQVDFTPGANRNANANEGANIYQHMMNQ